MGCSNMFKLVGRTIGPAQYFFFTSVVLFGKQIRGNLASFAENEQKITVLFLVSAWRPKIHPLFRILVKIQAYIENLSNSYNSRRKKGQFSAVLYFCAEARDFAPRSGVVYVLLV